MAHLDVTWSVNDTLGKYPSTVAVFNRFGIDACCGGAASIADAAIRDGADPRELLNALKAASGVVDGDAGNTP